MQVNERISKITNLLNMLKESEVPVSGEKIASCLGISRVAVWKIISDLKEKGYSIDSTHCGYRLLSSTDRPVPWEMGDIQGTVEYHAAIDSTMHKAEHLLDAGCGDGTVVIAGRQSAGINVTGGKWQSPDGGLYLTRIRTRPFPALYSGLYTIAAAAAVVKVLRKNHGIEAVIDWPGGVEVGGRKISGVLTEFRGSYDTVFSASAGIGININSSEGLPPDAVSIKEISKRDIAVKVIASDLLEELENQDLLFPYSVPISEYSSFLKIMGRRVSIQKADDKKISGIIDSLDISGALKLKTAEGHFEYIFSGDKTEDEQQE